MYRTESTGKIAAALSLALKGAEVTALVAVSLFLFQLRQTARDADLAVKQVTATAVEVQQRVKDTSQNLNAILIQAGLAADQARLASMEQRQYLRQISKETIALLGRAQDTVGNLNRVTADADTNLNAVSTSLVHSLDQIPALIDQGNKTLASANTLVSDPSIPVSLKNLSDATKNTAEVTQHLAAATADIQKKVHELTKPVSVVKQIFTTLLGWGANLAQILK